MSHHLDRALILFEQSRLDLAEKELRLALSAEPDHPRAHALLALCLAKREKFADATEEARRAIALAPDQPFCHYVMGSVLHERHRFDEAAEAVEEAIRLYPEAADFWALLAAIRFNQRRWPAALEAAQTGLSHDAEHTGCNNLRAMALVKLGRKAEAGVTIDAALARDPEDAFSHANMGWTLLHQGDSKKALEHFREALRIDPTMEFARAGIVEALKARNIIYALMLRYFLWMSSLSRRAQWLIIIGGFIGYRYLFSLVEDKPELGPWLWPVLGAYIAFAIMTWIADPLFNLTLRLSRFGRMALSREQRSASNWLGGYLILLAVSTLAWILSDHFWFELNVGLWLMLGLPFAGTIRLSAGWPRQVMIGLTTVLALLALVLLFMETAVSLNPEWDGPEVDRTFRVVFSCFTWGVILSTWAAMILAGVQLRR